MNLHFGRKILLTFLNWYGSLYSFGKSRWACIGTTAYSSCPFGEVTGFDIDPIDHLRLFVWCGGWVIVLIRTIDGVGIGRVCIWSSIDSGCMGIVILSTWTEDCISSLSAILGCILFRSVYLIIWWGWDRICIVGRTGDFCHIRWVIVVVIWNSGTWGMYSLNSLDSLDPIWVISLNWLLLTIHSLVTKISCTYPIIIVVAIHNSRRYIIPIIT